MRPIAPQAAPQVRTSKLLLQLRDVEETSVGGLEEGDAEREPDAHEEVLDVVRQHRRHGGPDGVHDLAEHPVAVEEGDSGEGERHAAEPEDGVAAVGQAEGHAGEDEDGPYRAKGDVEDADRVPVGETRWHIVDGESWNLVHCCRLFFCLFCRNQTRFRRGQSFNKGMDL